MKFLEEVIHWRDAARRDSIHNNTAKIRLFFFLYLGSNCHGGRTRLYGNVGLFENAAHDCKKRKKKCESTVKEHRKERAALNFRSRCFLFSIVRTNKTTVLQLILLPGPTSTTCASW